MRGALLVVLGALALTLPSAIQEAAGTPLATKLCPKECATFMSKAIPQNLLQKYEKSTCGKAAVILITKKDRFFCANPEDNWVKLAMHKLDEKNAPPSPTVDTSLSEKQLVLHNHSGTAMPTSAQAGGPARPTPETPVTSTSYTPFDSEDPKGSPAQSTPHPSSISLSSPLTDPARSGTKSATISPDRLTLSNLPGSIPRSPSTGPGQVHSTVSPTSLPHWTDFTGQSSTPFGSDGSRTSSVNMTDRRGVVNPTTSSFGDASRTLSAMEANRHFVPKSSGTLPTSHQEESMTEKIRAAETTSCAPEVLGTSLPDILSAYRTHFITLATLGGIFCISAVAWVYAKLSIRTTSPPNDMVQGLLFTPSKYQTNAYTIVEII